MLLYELLTAVRPFSRATAAATPKSTLTDEVPDVRSGEGVDGGGGARDVREVGSGWSGALLEVPISP